MHKVIYKIIKNSSWGIYIELTCDHVYRCGHGDIILDLSRVDWLSAYERDCLLRAVEYVIDSPERRGFNRVNIEIVVTCIDFNPCDYQPEGLTWALVQWMAEALAVDVVCPRIVFNKDKNRYGFNVS